MKILIFYGITITMVKINILQYLHISSTSPDSLLTSVVASYKVYGAQRDSWEVEKKWRYYYYMVRNTIVMLFLHCFFRAQERTAHEWHMYVQMRGRLCATRCVHVHDPSVPGFTTESNSLHNKMAMWKKRKFGKHAQRQIRPVICKN